MMLFFPNLSFSILNAISAYFKSYSISFCRCFSYSFTGFPFLTPFLDGKKSVNVNMEAEQPSVLLIRDKKLGLLL